jgi:hypothetical protein
VLLTPIIFSGAAVIHENLLLVDREPHIFNRAEMSVDQYFALAIKHGQLRCFRILIWSRDDAVAIREEVEMLSEDDLDFSLAARHW